MYRPPIPYPIQESILVGLFVGGEASKLFIARLRKGANESAEKGHKQVLCLFDTISHWRLSCPFLITYKRERPFYL